MINANVFNMYIMIQSLVLSSSLSPFVCVFLALLSRHEPAALQM